MNLNENIRNELKIEAEGEALGDSSKDVDGVKVTSGDPETCMAV